MNEYFDCNARTLRIQAENEVAVILSNFSTDYIYSAIKTSIDNKKNDFTGIEQANFVSSLEEAFKGMLSQYPFDKTNIMEIRNQTYEEIINFLTDAHDLEPVYQEMEEKYGLAFFLYDLLISKYDLNLINFFMNVIYNEKQAIYNQLAAEEAAKSKDITTLFNKELYKDEQLAVIAANLNRVIGYIYSLDLTMDQVLDRIYNHEITMLFVDHIKSPANFMKSVFGKTIENRILYNKASLLLKMKLNQDATGGRIPAYGI